MPKSSEQLETRESLANLAVSQGGENYIGKFGLWMCKCVFWVGLLELYAYFLFCAILEEYLRSISAVDSILNLDRMRQSVYLREQQLKNQTNRPNSLIKKSGMENNIRKTLSVPNISQLFVPIKLLPTSGNQMTNSMIGNELQQGQEQINGSISRRRQPLRSESLANLSGYASRNNENNTVLRPSSLNIGKLR